MATPEYNWQLKKGKFIDIDSFGREIFFTNTSGINFIYIKDGYLMNLAELIIYSYFLWDHCLYILSSKILQIS
ncbi:MAG: hypothetical protein QW046_00350 [Candidatus Micrarchaeaceae archaeon]